MAYMAKLVMWNPIEREREQRRDDRREDREKATEHVRRVERAEIKRKYFLLFALIHSV